MFTEHVNSFSTIELIAKMLSKGGGSLRWSGLRTFQGTRTVRDSSCCWCQVDIDEEQKLLLPSARLSWGKPPPIK